MRPEGRAAEEEELSDERGDARFTRAIVEGRRRAGRDVCNRLEGVIADGKETRAVAVGEDTRGAGGVTDDGVLTLVGGSTPGETTRGRGGQGDTRNGGVTGGETGVADDGRMYGSGVDGRSSRQGCWVDARLLLGRCVDVRGG